MFGSGFGARTTSAFGQTSTFGRPSTSFASPGFGTSSTSLFGQTSQPNTSLFGSTTPTQSFGGFASGSGTSLFGSQQPTPGTGGSLFGTQNASSSTSGFGSGTTSFGSNMGGLGTFGSSSGPGLFGQTQQSSTQSSTLFGQPSTPGTGLFGSSTSAFATGGTAVNGTTIKFNPVTGTDTMQRNAATTTINTKHHCITCMKEYEGKSLEELRYEDYLANRKGPTPGTQVGGNLFGSAGQSTLFGNNTSTASTSGGSLFGSGGFGQTSVFGQGSSLQSGTSLFGKPSSTAPFGTTTTTPSSGFGSFGQSSSIFGSNANQAKPTFGVTQPATGGLFGSSTGASTGFGTQPNSFGFNQQQPNTGIGLFGQTQNKFGGFGTQTTANFTFGSNTSTATTSLFGQKPATTGFGITPTTSASAFGTTPFGSGAATGGGLFSGGFNKPQATAFSFNPNTSTAPTLGQPNLNGSSLFGNTATKSAGLFGNTSTSTGLFGSGGFGSTGFGSANNTGFGTMTFNSGGLGSNLGGVQPNASSTNVSEQIQLLTVMPYGDSPLYKHLRPLSGKTEDLLKPSMIPQKQNTDNSNFKVSTQINNIVTRKAHSALEPAKKSLFDNLYDDLKDKNLSQQKANPRYLKLKPKSILNKNKILSNESNSEQSPASTGDTNKENIEAGRTFTIDSPYSPQTEVLSFSKNPSLPTSPNFSENENCESPSNTMDPNKNTSAYGDTMYELRTQPKPTEKKNVSFRSDNEASYISYNASSSFASEKSEDEDNANEIVDSKKEHSCGINLRRGDYFTVPSLSELDEKVDNDGRCFVKNFTVGRHKFGNVMFYDEFDVSGLDLDAIVFFRHKEVEIYPNDEIKPPVGTGLNRRAQVTLDRVWPQDKTTREVITSPEKLKQMNFIMKLKRSSAKMNAQFIEYRPLTGSWVFEVEHFSKYGLDDSDEELPQNVDEKAKKLVSSKLSSKPADLKKVFVDKDYSIGKKRGLDGKVISSDSEIIVDRFLYDENDEVMDDEHFSYSPPSKHDSDREYYENEVPSPIEKLVRDLDTSLHKVQLMKASFYVDENVPLDPEISLEKGIPDLDLFATGRIDAYRSTLATKNFPSLLKTQFTSQFPPTVEIPFTNFADEEYKPPLYSPEIKPIPAIPHVVMRPQRVNVKYRNGIVPLEQSIFKNIEKSVCDAGLYFGQHFRVGWGCGLTLASQCSLATANTVVATEVDRSCKVLSGRKSSDYSSNLVYKLQMAPCGTTEVEKTVENHLKICLKETNFAFEEGCPILTPKLSTEALHAHCDVEQRVARIDEDYNRQVWELMVALWGNIPDVELDYDPKSHKNKMLRKTALSDWLKKVVSSVAEKEINDYNVVSSIVILLSAGKILEAAKLAMSNNDYNLALLISQIGGCETTRSLMEQQLKQWHESEADQLIDTGRLKIMALVAGHMLFISSKHLINASDDLDWRRAFALHLWYVTRPSDSLVEALKQYEIAFKSENKFACAPPDPPYAKDILEYETTDGHKAQDLCYHLLKLYSRRSYSLETLLNPITHTANILDYRLSWFIMVTLKSLGYNHLSEESEYTLHTSFAAQLETQKLWHWSVYVLLYIKDLNCRVKCVMDMIGRNVQLLPNKAVGFSEEEKFVYEKLEIPAAWIYGTKAELAVSLNRYSEAAWYYVKAERWNEAHEVIMNHLVTNAIINENYAELQELLNEIVASELVISGWNYKGGIIYDYLTIMNEINAIIAEKFMETPLILEKLQPVMNSVCTKIKFFPTSTVKERLCQAEISKRIIQFIRTVFNLQYGKGGGMSVRFLVSLVDQLPLPEDYKQQELQEIISGWISK